MKLKKILSEIAQHEEIVKQPPVLLDVGASGNVNATWKLFSKFSICILFDADDRDFNYDVNENGAFKKAIKVNKILVAKSSGKKESFHLTTSPHCSSILEPDSAVLSEFHYSPLFNVVKKIPLETVDLPTILKDLSLDYIDWFKTDSQGTDLSLFTSLDESIQDRLMVAEFEPGFISFYKGEERVLDCFNYLEQKKEFFLVNFIVKGPLKIPAETFDPLFSNNFAKKVATNTYDKVPGWAEMTFMNDLKKLKGNAQRPFIVGWLFSTAQNNHAVANYYAAMGMEKFKGVALFENMQQYSLRRLKYDVYSLSTFWKLVKKLGDRIFG